MSSDIHREKMQALQAEQRRKVRDAQNPNRGLVLVHTGDGKGKSSSAFGVIARSLGWGQKVAVVQFIKGTWKTGEKQFFARFPDELEWHTTGEGFTWDTQDKERDIEVANAGLDLAAGLLARGDLDLVVLDEINIAIGAEYLSSADVIQRLDERAEKTHVILTGRGATEELQTYADLVTEMREIKHPFQAGIKAQQGIDF